MKNPRVVGAGAALIGMWAEASASSSVQWFAEGVADPILDGIRGNGAFNQSTGPEPFLRAFIDGEVVPYYNSCYVLNPHGQPDCHKIEGECAPSEVSCGYVYMITALVLSAVIAVGVFALIGICSCGCCMCPSNSAPRRTRPWGAVGESRSKTRIFTMWALGLTGSLVMIFSVIGFLSMLELSGEVVTLLQGVNKASKVAAELKERALDAITLAQENAEQFVVVKDERLRGISRIVTAVDRVRESMQAMKQQTIKTEAFVEGCPAGATVCKHAGSTDTVDVKNWNQCEFDPADSSGKHDLGVSAVLSNGNPNPACRDKKTGEPTVCPCCTQCDKLARSIDLVSSQIPTAKDIEALNVSFAVEQVPGAASELFLHYKDSMNTAIDSLVSLTAWATQAQRTMESYHWVFALVAVGFWIPSWIAVGIVVFGCMLVANHGNNRTLWWTAFGLGLASCLLLLAPIFGIASLVVIPFSDLCDVIPRNNHSSAAFLALLEGDLSPDLLFRSPLQAHNWVAGNILAQQNSRKAHQSISRIGEPAARDDTASKLINGCLLNKDGLIWDMMGLKRSDLDSDLKIQKASVTLPPALVDKALNVQRYRDMSGIQKEINNLDAENPAFGVSDCGAPSYKGCQSDMEVYDQDLEADFGALKLLVGGFGLAAHTLVTLSGEEQKNISVLLSEADKAADTIEKTIWHAGSCDFLNERYEGLRAPLCDQMAVSIRATWAAILLAALAWVPLLVLLLIIAIRGWKCWTSKYDFQLILNMDEDDEGGDQESEYVGMSPGTEFVSTLSRFWGSVTSASQDEWPRPVSQPSV